MLSDSPTLVLSGSSRAAEMLRKRVASAAASDANVLLSGEPGVGKTSVARHIHDQSARHGDRFAVVPCDLLPERVLLSELFGHEEGSFDGAYRSKVGLLRQANHGTLVLQGLARLGRDAQLALLRFADSGEVRPIGASNAGMPVETERSNITARAAIVRLIGIATYDLSRRLQNGAFRADLVRRLAGLEITIPTVRERHEDIPLLFEQCLEHASNVHGLPAVRLSETAAECAQLYQWPGNMREMRRVAERLVIRHGGRTLNEGDLRAELDGCRGVAGGGATAS
jgi:DNA-binding NtrC family response regulator